MTRLLIGFVLCMQFVGLVSTANAQDAQTVRLGSLSVKLPIDAQKGDSWTNTAPLRIERTSRYHSNSVLSTVTLSYIEYQESRPAEQRLVAFLHSFVENYGAIDHLVSIKESDRKGMNIKALVYLDRSGSRYTYVESRVFAEKNKLYFITVESNVNDNNPEQVLKTADLAEIFASMKVN
jgi:hypothetical protein